MTRALLDHPPFDEARPRQVLHEDSDRGEVARDALRQSRVRSDEALADAVSRNHAAFRNDLRLARICKAYHRGDEAERVALESCALGILARLDYDREAE